MDPACLGGEVPTEREPFQLTLGKCDAYIMFIYIYICDVLGVYFLARVLEDSRSSKTQHLASVEQNFCEIGSTKLRSV